MKNKKDRAQPMDSGALSFYAHGRPKEKCQQKLKDGRARAGKVKLLCSIAKNHIWKYAADAA